MKSPIEVMASYLHSHCVYIRLFFSGLSQEFRLETWANFFSHKNLYRQVYPFSLQFNAIQQNFLVHI